MSADTIDRDASAEEFARAVRRLYTPRLLAAADCAGNDDEGMTPFIGEAANIIAVMVGEVVLLLAWLSRPDADLREGAIKALDAFLDTNGGAIADLRADQDELADTLFGDAAPDPASSANPA